MRRHDRVARVDAPCGIVEIEFRFFAQKVHVRFPQTLDRSDVLPVSLERIGDHLFARVQHGGNDVLAEVVVARFIRIVALHVVAQKLPVENIDAHRGVVALRNLRLFLERNDRAVFIGVHDAEPVRFLHRNLQDRDRRRRIVCNVELQHLRVVHLIDMVARKDQHVIRIVLIDEGAVLPDRVCRAGIPASVVLGHVRRKHEHAAVTAVEVPVLTGAEIGIQRQRAVLRQNADGVNVGIDAVGQRKIDDSVLSAEGDRRLRHAGGQDAETTALSAGKQHAHDFLFHSFAPFEALVLAGVNRKKTAPYAGSFTCRR